MSAPPAIDVQHLRKSFGDLQILRDLTFTVSPGTIFALLGSNGSGKTTTINILTTLIRPDAGTATVCGFDVTQHPDQVRRRISVTGQFAAVDNILTARENLELIGRLRHDPNPAQRATLLLDRFDLTAAADRRVATFSGGMRRRLDIALSLIGDPAVIFLDEPTTGLDPEARSTMWDTIRALASQGATVFMTTQYLEEADQLANHIAMLHQGRIAAAGTTTELKQLVPSGLIELTFSHDAQVDQTRELLEPSFPVTASAALGLVIETDGTVRHLAQVFDQLRDAGLEPATFAQKTPTLDDVFFSITNEMKEQR